MPNAFEFTIQSLQPLDPTNFYGLISTAKESYDFSSKLFRIDYSESNSLITEVHDFNIGSLKFNSNKQ